MYNATLVVGQQLILVLFCTNQESR